MEEIKPLCYETICVGLRLYNTPLAPIIRKIPSAQDPPGRPILSPDPKSQPCPSRALRPHYLCSFRRPCRRGLVPVPPILGPLQFPPPPQTGQITAQSSQATRVKQSSWYPGWGSRGWGWRTPGRGEEGEKADRPPLSRHKMAFEDRVPTPTRPPAVQSTSHLSIRSSGGGSRGWADALPSADAHQPPASPLIAN